MAAAAVRFRRAEALIIHGRDGRLIATNYLLRRQTPLTPALLEVLAWVSTWTTARAFHRAHPGLGTVAAARRLLSQLSRLGLLDQTSTRRPGSRLGGWAGWHPEAACFHFGTKNDTYLADPRGYEARLVLKAQSHPPPAPCKHVSGTRVPLPAAADCGALGRTLLARRTWRQFGPGALGRQDLGTLLGLTFGVQHHAHVRGQGPIVLKTSPSGGARHSIEAYVIALRIAGAPRGSVFHYRADSHRLYQLPGRTDRRRLTKMLGHQYYFSQAAAIVVMAPLFVRTQWRYASPRVYRAILVEAGHLCQTWCLVATHLGLAPFCTLAFSELALERLLGLDGIGETAVYVAGVGPRPPASTPPGAIPQRLRANQEIP